MKAIVPLTQSLVSNSLQAKLPLLQLKSAQSPEINLEDRPQSIALMKRNAVIVMENETASQGWSASGNISMGKDRLSAEKIKLYIIRISDLSY